MRPRSHLPFISNCLVPTEGKCKLSAWEEARTRPYSIQGSRVRSCSITYVHPSDSKRTHPDSWPWTCFVAHHMNYGDRKMKNKNKKPPLSFGAKEVFEHCSGFPEHGAHSLARHFFSFLPLYCSFGEKLHCSTALNSLPSCYMLRLRTCEFEISGHLNYLTFMYDQHAKPYAQRTGW